MWKPNLCSACFQPHTTGAVDSSLPHPASLRVASPLQEEQDASCNWEFKHRLHVDPLRKSVLAFPFVENVHFKSTINNRDVSDDEAIVST
jgi:hypothetical protein